MIRYKAMTGWRTKIGKVDVVRETEKSVFIRVGITEERREAKQSIYGNYFDTWKGARDHLLAVAKNAVDRNRQRLADAEAELFTVEEMKETP